MVSIGVVLVYLAGTVFLSDLSIFDFRFSIFDFRFSIFDFLNLYKVAPGQAATLYKFNFLIRPPIMEKNPKAILAKED